MSFSHFSNKIVWITGASAGIGEAIAHAFAKEGAQLVLSARSTDKLNEVAEKCRQLGAPKTWVIPMDLAQPASVEQAIISYDFSVGKSLDILVNNGGVSQRSLVDETDMSVYRQLMEINYFGTVALTKGMLPYLKNNTAGSIITISSVAGKLGTPLRSGYAACKHALHGFFDSLRAEIYKNNIQVLLVCPGYIRTNVSVNALNAKGATTGEMDKNQAEGMPPEKLAQKIINAVKGNKQEIYVGGKEIIGIYLKRFFPKLLNKIVRKQINQTV
ncbi:SDR family oxidoreductase [Polluticaenibacter yanchengensis]|uniref:SDR family oxidoreductase n=1 Tax=Polluticaenibacter yanchengensis TaxID=3014562 RepID=A0ABT4UHC8_9BACT|nr:SDR family oxidoreductase [Chitinophagaceae bacterium LY-5]